MDWNKEFSSQGGGDSTNTLVTKDLGQYYAFYAQTGLSIKIALDVFVKS